MTHPKVQKGFREMSREPTEIEKRTGISPKWAEVAKSFVGEGGLHCHWCKYIAHYVQVV